jgi:hypothetical protein
MTVYGMVPGLAIYHLTIMPGCELDSVAPRKTAALRPVCLS